MMEKPRVARDRNGTVDMLRPVLIFLIVVDHGPGGWEYSERNVFAVGLWVLYWVVGLSGMLFARSKTALLDTQLRLAALFAVGLCCNHAGMVLRGVPSMAWLHDRHVAYDTVYQMFYVLGLLLCNVHGEAAKRVGKSLTYPKLLVTLACCLGWPILQCYALGLWSLVDAVRVGLWLSLAVLTVWFSEQGSPRAIAMLFAAFAVTCVGPDMCLNWNNDHGAAPLRAKAVHCTAAWLLGFMWGYAQEHVGTRGLVRAIDTYWPLAVPVILASAVPDRVDLVGVSDPTLRAGVLASWVFFALLFARLTILAEDRPDYAGVTRYLNEWAILMYVTHMLQHGLFDGLLKHPAGYHRFLWSSFAFTMALGAVRTGQAEAKVLEPGRLSKGASATYGSVSSSV